MSTTEQVAAEDLVPGMYVAELDRPWLETPFLFQGFQIKNRQEIDELRRYCRYVYVTRADSAASREHRSVAATALPARRRRPRIALLRRLWRTFRLRPAGPCTPKPGEFYEDTVEIRVEVDRARDVHAQASSALAEMLERVRSGGKLDVAALSTVVSPMIESIMRNRDALAWLSRMKQTDDYTYGHSVSCAIYAIAFGRHLGLPREDLETLGLGGLLLDVGKTRVPRELLAKSEPLTPTELAAAHAHVHHGLAILGEHPDLDPRVLQMVRSHHERYDGSGYPDKLRGPDIPVFARIAGIVDFYDALITPRPYAGAISSFDATRELNKRANIEFQAEMVEQFIQTVGVFPNGALVELCTGEVGVVTEQNRVRRLRPKLMLILDRDKQPIASPRTIDLRDHPAEPGDKRALWIERGLPTRAYDISPAEYYL
jgi:HD-GYP domain-containing protein (c-di-GMP phosphodiesterase class II)